MDKRSLSERDICIKFITPAPRQAGWDEMLQIREEVSFTKGRIIVRGKLVSRGKGKRADIVAPVSDTRLGQRGRRLAGQTPRRNTPRPRTAA
jgi:type I site-specific restriction endonuclease